MQTKYEETYSTKKCLAENEMIFQRFLKLCKGEPVLEIASGYGDPFTCFISAHVSKDITGLDIDVEMLESNRWLSERVYGSLSKFPVKIAKKEFAAVMNLFGVYGSREDVFEMLLDSWSVLKVGGDLIIVAFGKGRKDTSFAKDLLARWGLYPEYTVDGMKTLAKSTGFDVQECFGFGSTLFEMLSFLPTKWFSRMFNNRVLDHVNIPKIRNQYIFLWAKKP